MLIMSHESLFHLYKVTVYHLFKLNLRQMRALYTADFYKNTFCLIQLRNQNHKFMVMQKCPGNLLAEKISKYYPFIGSLFYHREYMRHLVEEEWTLRGRQRKSVTLIFSLL